MKTFFVSDTHHNHFRIISYCSRPFKDINHMNEVMIKRWNEKVSKDDLVYHLGDFAMGSKALIPGIRKRLNGKIILIKGNHDSSATRMLEYGFDEVHNSLTIDIDGYKCFLQHKPAISETLYEGCDYVLCGHVHQAWARKGKMINVGVDVSNFYPLTITELINRDKEYPPTIILDEYDSH